jgi:microcystin degradation protein MlrC
MRTEIGPVRLAVAGLIHETNTYATEFTGLTSLSAFDCVAGEDIDRKFANANHQVGGFIRAARKHGANLLHTFMAEAHPSGVISADAYSSLKNAVLDGIRAALPLNGVLLALHGAGVAESTDDVEGDLATAIRAVVGPRTAIAAVYDLHGNMTEEMRRACDLTLPCKLYPHTDLGIRGEEAVDLLMRIVDKGLRPVTYVRSVAMLASVISTEVGFVPEIINDLCSKVASRPGVLDCSWFHGFPYADIAAPSPSVICTTDGDEELAKRCGDEIATWIWNHRDDFVQDFCSPAVGVERALACTDGPIVLNEYSDNPGGGAPGDGTRLLRALLDARPAPDTCCFAAINDPDVVRQAMRAGPGGTIRISLGGKMGRYQGEPIIAEAYVKCVTDGRFTNLAGSVFEGLNFQLGKMCRLVIRGVDVIVSSSAGQIFDPSPFQLHGIDVMQRRVVAIKSANHFRSGFRNIAKQIITVDSVGLSSSDASSLPRIKLTSNLWPLSVS